MMNKQELQNEINKIKEQLANLVKMLAGCEYERWKPEKGKAYYYVTSTLEVWVDINCNARSDIGRFEGYNCFQTREQAEAEAEKILVRRMLEDIARRLNKGRKIDWFKCYQKKYYLGYSYINSRITRECRTTMIAEGAVYCLDENFLDVAIQEIGEERLKKYLRGECNDN